MKNYLTLLILMMVLCSCDHMLGRNRYSKLVKDCDQMLTKYYEVDCLFDHFPKSISYKSLLNAEYYMPVNLKGFSFTADLVVISTIDGDVDKYMADTFLLSSYYQEDNFIIDPSFKYYKFYDNKKDRNDFKLGRYPMPYFENYDFGLGTEQVNFITDTGFEWVFDKPMCLMIYRFLF